MSGLFSIFGRVDYAFDDKYLIGATLRRDGSSVFGPEKRYGVFPSVSLGWRVTSEKFMQNIQWLNDLKVRGSYGILGSQNNVSSTNQFSLYGSGLATTYYDITGASTSTVLGFSRSRIGNPYTGWEENVVINAGFDATVLNNKLDLSVEWYKKSINGLLFTEPLPAVIIGGASAPTINIGDIQNTGIDGMVRYHGKIANDLNFTVGLNVTSYKMRLWISLIPGISIQEACRPWGPFAVTRKVILSAHILDTGLLEYSRVMRILQIHPRNLVQPQADGNMLILTEMEV
jgi:hypothetical protein